MGSLFSEPLPAREAASTSSSSRVYHSRHRYHPPPPRHYSFQNYYIPPNETKKDEEEKKAAAKKKRERKKRRKERRKRRKKKKMEKMEKKEDTKRRNSKFCFSKKENEKNSVFFDGYSTTGAPTTRPFPVPPPPPRSRSGPKINTIFDMFETIPSRNSSSVLDNLDYGGNNMNRGIPMIMRTAPTLTSAPTNQEIQKEKRVVRNMNYVHDQEEAPRTGLKRKRQEVEFRVVSGSGQAYKKRKLD